MESIIELLGMVASRLTDTAQSEVVVGEPIDLGAVKIVPLSRLSLGMGMAGGEGDGEYQSNGKKRTRSGSGKGNGSASAIGARVRPVGVAIFSDDGVQVLPIADRKGILDKIFDKIPRVIELVEGVLEKQGKLPAKGASAPKEIGEVAV